MSDIQITFFPLPVTTVHCLTVRLMLDQRRRRWSNIKPALGQRLVFVGVFPTCHLSR